MSTSTMNIADLIASAVNNPVSDVPCTYCGVRLTIAEVEAIKEASGKPVLDEDDRMCDKCANSDGSEAPQAVVQPQVTANAALEAEMTRLKLENELLKLKKENAALAAGKTTSAPDANRATNTGKIAAPPQNRSTIIENKALSAGPVAYTPRDLKLLEIITKFKSAPRADKKPSGALAVKVHAHLHACKVPEAIVRQVIADAEKRNVISMMTVPTKNGNRMMLYFDARERPNNHAYERKTEVPTDAAETAALFA